MYLLQHIVRSVRRRLRATETKPKSINLSALHYSDSQRSGWFKFASRELHDLFVVSPNDLLIDLGCGGGLASVFSARCGARVISNDVDPQKVKVTSERLKADVESSARTGAGGRLCDGIGVGTLANSAKR